MSNIPVIRSSEIEHLLNWTDMSEALKAGHLLKRADIGDIQFKNGDDSMLNRVAWIKGLGIAVKTATIFPNNSKLEPGLPGIHTVFTLFDDKTGVPVAMIDGTMMTKWKTAADSILGASFLARHDSRTLLIIGAGAVARSLVEAYTSVFPGLDQVLIWNRTLGKARELASSVSADGCSVDSVSDLASSAARADIISSATMSVEPVLKGEWVAPGTHVDLIGAYRPDMREADDLLIQKSDIYVNARETTVRDIGELIIPIRNGVMTERDVIADLYDLCNGAPGRPSDEAITLYKNGGGAHLDLMTANYIFNLHKAQTG